MAVFYFRQEPLPDSFSSIDGLIDKYKRNVVSKNEVLRGLFCDGPNFSDAHLFGTNALTPSEYRACYPHSPYSSKEQSAVRLYKEDVIEIKKNLREGHSVADYISELIKT
jgi:hypothetical protein